MRLVGGVQRQTGLDASSEGAFCATLRRVLTREFGVTWHVVLAESVRQPPGAAPATYADASTRLLASVAAGQCKATLERFHGVARCLSPGDAQRIYAEFHALVVRREMLPSASYTPPCGDCGQDKAGIRLACFGEVSDCIRGGIGARGD